MAKQLERSDARRLLSHFGMTRIGAAEDDFSPISRPEDRTRGDAETGCIIREKKDCRNTKLYRMPTGKLQTLNPMLLNKLLASGALYIIGSEDERLRSSYVGDIGLLDALKRGAHDEQALLRIDNDAPPIRDAVMLAASQGQAFVDLETIENIGFQTKTAGIKGR